WRLRCRDRRLPRRHRRGRHRRGRYWRGRHRRGRRRHGRVRRWRRTGAAAMNGATRIVRAVSDDLEAAGLRARIIARDLDSGTQVSLAPDGLVPLASVAKVPIALAVLTRISDGVVA